MFGLWYSVYFSLNIWHVSSHVLRPPFCLGTWDVTHKSIPPPPAYWRARIPTSLNLLSAHCRDQVNRKPEAAMHIRDTNGALYIEHTTWVNAYAHAHNHNSSIWCYSCTIHALAEILVIRIDTTYIALCLHINYLLYIALSIIWYAYQCLPSWILTA